MTTELVTGGAREGAAEFTFTTEAFDMRTAPLEERYAVLRMFVRHTSEVRRLQTPNDLERVARQEGNTDFFVVRDDSTKEIVGFATGSADYKTAEYDEEVVVPVPEEYVLGPLVVKQEFDDLFVRIALGSVRREWAEAAGHRVITKS